MTVRHHACLCLCDEQVLFAAGLALAFGLDNWAGNTTDYEISKLTIFGIFIAYIYSAPPLKLKVMSLTAGENKSDKPACLALYDLDLMFLNRHSTILYWRACYRITTPPHNHVSFFPTIPHLCAIFVYRIILYRCAALCGSGYGMGRLLRSRQLVHLSSLALRTGAVCVLYCTVLYCTVLYCTVLYCTVLYYTILYYTVMLLSTL